MQQNIYIVIAVGNGGNADRGREVKRNTLP